ncbi:MAG: DUF501 domain-containing protein [Propionibacteriaceae bacterium]|nr:DUF501 domain-containing protein [Propionibacteriaceae bacterium]
MTPASSDDLVAIAAQLGREPRAVAGVAWRCPCGRPGVAATAPRLPDGTPFPTTYYLTCPNAVAACSRLEASGVMASMSARLATDDDLRVRYEAAHAAYLADRARLAASLGVADVPRSTDSAGGMPSRVKCLHALVGHALAAGPGVNPLGDEALAAIGEFWRQPCLGDDLEAGRP